MHYHDRFISKLNLFHMWQTHNEVNGLFISLVIDSITNQFCVITKNIKGIKEVKANENKFCIYVSEFQADVCRY